MALFILAADDGEAGTLHEFERALIKGDVLRLENADQPRIGPCRIEQRSKQVENGPLSFRGQRTPHGSDDRKACVIERREKKRAADFFEATGDFRRLEVD